jgi:hypothetical protein
VPWQTYRRVILVHAVRRANELVYRDVIDETMRRRGAQFRYVTFVSREPHAGSLEGRIPAAIRDGRLEAACRRVRARALAVHAVRQPGHGEGRAGRARRAGAAQAPAPGAGPDHRGDVLVALVRVLLVCVLLGFSGCSTVRFAYNNADIYLRWQLGKYLDVQDAQLEEVEQHIAAFLAWHRANALPQYIRLVNEASSRFARGISQEDLVWGYDSLQAQVLQAVRAAAGEMADLLDRLTPEQIAYMERRFAEDNRSTSARTSLGASKNAAAGASSATSSGSRNGSGT